MKQNNTPAYREAKRVVSFVDPEVKKAIVKAAKYKKISLSKELATALKELYIG